MPVYRSQVSISHPSLGGVGSNTWHARTTDPWTASADADLVALTTDLEQFYADVSGAIAGGTVFQHDGQWVRIDDESQTIAAHAPWDFTVAGSVAPLPPANCLVVSWKTSVATRRGRGRTFLGPVQVPANESNGTPTEPVRTLIATACSTLISTFSGIEDGALCVWSELDSVGRDFVSGSVANKFGVLRSRRD